MRSLLELVLLGLLLATVDGLSLRKGPGIPPKGPPGFDPVDLLCKFRDREQEWCKDWLTCLNMKSRPPTIENVKKAWSPADCKEICGVYPQVTPTEGLLQVSAATQQKQTTVAQLFGLSDKKQAVTKELCVKSCENFQDSLATCVGTIMFEPGKLSTMGGNKEEEEEPAEVCTKKDTPCLPDLPEKRQKCVGMAGKAAVAGEKFHPGGECPLGSDAPACVCEQLEFDWDDCKDCPQMRPGAGSQYTAFVGGCLDQLNAYWQATHPKAGATAIPGATGCTVH